MKQWWSHEPMKLGYSAAKAANQWAEEKHLSSARLANLSRDKAFLLREPWKILEAGAEVEYPLVMSN